MAATKRLTLGRRRRDAFDKSSSVRLSLLAHSRVLGVSQSLAFPRSSVLCIPSFSFVFRGPRSFPCYFIRLFFCPFRVLSYKQFTRKKCILKSALYWRIIIYNHNPQTKAPLYTVVQWVAGVRVRVRVWLHVFIFFCPFFMWCGANPTRS